MTTNSQTLADALKNLEGKVVDSYVDGWTSYWKLVTDVARDPASLQEAQKEYLTHVAQTAPSHLSKTFQAGMQVCGALILSTGQLASQMYTQTGQNLQSATTAAVKATEAATVSASQAVPAAPSEFTFEGHAGETVGRRFLVSNKSSLPVAVALEVSNFVPDPGVAPLQVNLIPQAFSLGANEETVVECHVTIPETLDSLTTFRAVLAAPGALSLNIGLNVRSLGVREVVFEDAPSV